MTSTISLCEFVVKFRPVLSYLNARINISHPDSDLTWEKIMHEPYEYCFYPPPPPPPCFECFHIHKSGVKITLPFFQFLPVSVPFPGT